MSEQASPPQKARTLKCTRCDSDLEDCAYCNEPDCPAPICYGCLDVALSPEAPPMPRKGADLGS